jgi:hypothetical protein
MKTLIIIATITVGIVACVSGINRSIAQDQAEFAAHPWHLTNTCDSRTKMLMNDVYGTPKYVCPIVYDNQK